MSTLWLHAMSEYRHTDMAIHTARKIIELKVRQQSLVASFSTQDSGRLVRINEILLFEGRLAQKYWKQYTKLLPEWTRFEGRKARREDVTNRLLDIGYHHLAQKVGKILSQHDISPALAILHVPKTNKSKPLVYDLMELFRADLVDREALRFLRLKKKPMTVLNQKTIALFLHRLNERMERKVYLKEFKQCHTYAYYMEVQILKFMYAVNHQEVYKPIVLSKRHESRCP